MSSGKIFNMAPNNAGIPWPERKWLFLLGHLKFVSEKSMQMQMSSAASRYIKILIKAGEIPVPSCVVPIVGYTEYYVLKNNVSTYP